MTTNLEGMMRSLVLAGCVLTAALSPARAADVEPNKELYRHYIEDLWNKRNPAAADRYLAPDYIEHNTNLPPGLEGRKNLWPRCLRHFRTTMPRFRRSWPRATGWRRGWFGPAPRTASTRGGRRPTTSSAFPRRISFALPTARSPSIGTWSTYCPG
jgi:hypothetical protein